MIKGIVPLAAWPPEQFTNKRRTCSSLLTPPPNFWSNLLLSKRFHPPPGGLTFHKRLTPPLMRYLPSYTFRHCINNTPLLTPNVSSLIMSSFYLMLLYCHIVRLASPYSPTYSPPISRCHRTILLLYKYSLPLEKFLYYTRKFLILCSLCTVRPQIIESLYCMVAQCTVSAL